MIKGFALAKIPRDMSNVFFSPTIAGIASEIETWDVVDIEAGEEFVITAVNLDDKFFDDLGEWEGF